MKYRIRPKGFEGKKVEVEPISFLHAQKVLVNNIAVKNSWGKYELRRNDGKKAVLRVKPSFLSGTLRVDVDGEMFRLVEPLKWYQYLLAAMPLVSIFFGGALGAFIGFSTFAINTKIFRSKMSAGRKYLLVAAISVGVPVIFFVLFIMSMLAKK